jgi:hypothetical protein
MENPIANNSDVAAGSTVNEPTSNSHDEIGTVEEDSAPVPEQITGDNEEPVPLVQQVVAAISDEKLAAKETPMSSVPNEVHDADKGLDGADEASDAVLDADDEPLPPTNHQDTTGTDPTAALTLPSSDNAADRRESRENTEPTTALTTRSSDIPSGNATANAHLIEAYLVEEEELPIYDATPELPWWKQNRFKTLISLIFILLLLVAVLLAVFLGGESFVFYLFRGNYFFVSIISTICFVVSFIESTHFSKSKSRCVLPKWFDWITNTISHPHFVQLQFPGLLSEQE